MGLLCKSSAQLMAREACQFSKLRSYAKVFVITVVNSALQTSSLNSLFHDGDVIFLAGSLLVDLWCMGEPVALTSIYSK